MNVGNPAAGDVVRFEAVGCRYAEGPEVLADVSFSLPAGAMRFLTGASGAGKTTLVRLMSLALAPSRGRVTVFGEDVVAMPRQRRAGLRRRIGVVFQDIHLLDHLSAFDNVALPLRLAGTAEATVRAEVGELLRWVGLGDHVSARPATLSAGQRQLVAVARAIIARPQLLLVDEPTGGVDDGAALRVVQLFGELNRLGTAVVIATRSGSLSRHFGYPCLHLRGGRLLDAPDVDGPGAVAAAGRD